MEYASAEIRTDIVDGVSSPISMGNTHEGASEMTYNAHVNPVQWNQALGLARRSCSHVFQQGGGPADAIQLHGLSGHGLEPVHWGKAITLIALNLCRGHQDPRRSGVFDGEESRLRTVNCCVA